MSPLDQDTGITQVTDVTKPVVLPPHNDVLVVIYDEDKGYLRKRLDLTETVTRVGRDAEAHLVLESDGISRRHFRVERTAAGFVLVDESRNGTLVNDQRVVEPRVLRSGDRIRVGRIILRYLSGNDIEREYQDVIIQLTEYDQLTQLRSLRHFEDELAREINRARRHARPFSALYVDIDHFKKVNDTYGHDGGDTVLKSVAARILEQLAEADTAARIGGEEMAILMLETPLADAVRFAERLRASVARGVATPDGKGTVTISVGCAQYHDAETSAELRKRCDIKLYEAKEGGRNRVCW